MFNIRMGVPEMKQFWDNLEQKIKAKSASKKEIELFKKLSTDPRYPSLCTHDIEALTKRYNLKVWESYVENNKPAAERVFWVYGPGREDITVIGLEPHPIDEKDAYNKITLSVVEK